MKRYGASHPLCARNDQRRRRCRDGADAEDWEREQGKLAQWIRALPKPAGVMACYDIRGQQVLDVCRAAGVAVPDDVAVIGQHNDELLCGRPWRQGE